MKILLVMDPNIPVPPELYGGIERVVFLLANQYIKEGHHVTLLAGPGSHCHGQTVVFGENGEGSRLQQYKNVASVWKYLIKNKNQFNVVHNFGRLVYLLPIVNHDVKKIMSYQRQVTQKGISIINKLPNKNLKFTACSEYCVSTGNVAGNWTAVYNCIDFSYYRLKRNVTDNAPLMFLGRLDKIKGAHTAINVAKATGRKLILAGNKPDTADNLEYFKTEIEPMIDNDQIVYVGALNDEEKNKWLQESAALLFPIEWAEPFGIVMIEAMACGTPVIAFNRGAVPEVVENGITGFIVTDEKGMIKKLEDLHTIDRSECRDRAEKRFDISTIAADYLQLL